MRRQPGFALLSTSTRGTPPPPLPRPLQRRRQSNGTASPPPPASSFFPAATIATARANFNKLCHKLQAKAVSCWSAGACLQVRSERESFFLFFFTFF